MAPDVYPLAARGVYAQPYLRGGRREYYAVDSQGEQVAARMVPEGSDPSSAIAELWEELQLANPIAAHLESPALRLVR